MRSALRCSTVRQSGRPEYAIARTIAHWCSSLSGNILAISMSALSGFFAKIPGEETDVDSRAFGIGSLAEPA